MKSTILFSIGLIASFSMVSCATGRATQKPQVITSAQDLADREVGRRTIRSAAQPGTDSVAPLTEAVLLAGKDGSAATARVGFLTSFSTRESLAVDARLTNKPPDAGLPILSNLDGLSDGAELSGGFGWIHKPPSVVQGNGSQLITACDEYYKKHADRRRLGYQEGTCSVDAENEDDADLLRAIAPFVDSKWGYSLQARLTWSRPTFKFRLTTDATADTANRLQRSFKVSGSVLTPTNLTANAVADLLASWFLTLEATVGNDWDLTKAQNLCSPVAGAVSLKCENIAVGAPFDQNVRTAAISARRYFTDWAAIAPAWTKRWAERVDGRPAVDDGKWRFDLPFYFLSTTEKDKKGLTGGVAVSWTQGQGRQYSVFVGALLPPFEFK